jgi:uncharacterized membrane protein YjfL (UPF0719 family)
MQNLGDVVNKFIELGNTVIPFLAVVAFLIFILGIANLIRASSNEKELAERKKFLIWGVIGLFVMFMIWGILLFLRGEFGFSGALNIPQLPGSYP